MADLIGVDVSGDAPLNLESYERWIGAARALPLDVAKPVNVDPLVAQQAVRKALPKLRALVPRLKEEFSKFNEKDIDELHDLSCAFVHGTTLLRTVEPAGSGFDALASECGALRTKLEAYLRGAVDAGVLTVSRLDELKGGSSYRNTVHDLHILSQILRTNWAKVEGKTYLTQADVRHADAQAKRLNDALADRETSPGALEDANTDRQRIFVLFIKKYNVLRSRVRALLEQDEQEELLEEIMPTIYATRTTGKRRAEEPEVAPAPARGANSAGPTPPAASASSRIGMPDSDPFLPE